MEFPSCPHALNDCIPTRQDSSVERRPTRTHDTKKTGNVALPFVVSWPSLHYLQLALCYLHSHNLATWSTRAQHAIHVSTCSLAVCGTQDVHILAWAADPAVLDLRA